jgi:hypothetical protein
MPQSVDLIQCFKTVLGVCWISPERFHPGIRMCCFAHSRRSRVLLDQKTGVYFAWNGTHLAAGWSSTRSGILELCYANTMSSDLGGTLNWAGAVRDGLGEIAPNSPSDV